MRVCDRIVALEFGRKICEGPPKELANDPVLVAAYLGQPHKLEDAVAT
jgi:branched-chain amino acid transport system ATP-binding protein